jgi:O-antigen ligase/polysaccharide polymerase Wzy-like membrane protein
MRLFSSGSISHNFLLFFGIIALLPVLSGAQAPLYNSGLFPVPYPTFFLLFSFFFPVLVTSLLKNKFGKLARIYFKTAGITIPFAILTLISLIWALHPGANWEQNGRLIYYNFYHLVLLILAIAIPHAEAIRKNSRLVFLIILLSACTAVWVDLYFPEMIPNSNNRASGFDDNSNKASRSIVFLTIASINWKKNDLFNWLIFIFSGATVFSTLSVGGLSLFFFVCVLYIISMYITDKKFLLKLAFLGTPLLLIIFIASGPLLNNWVFSQERYKDKGSVSRIDEITGFFSGDFSFATEHERLNLARRYFEMIQAAPVVGYGTAFRDSTENDTHNIYLSVWLENGLFGFISLLALFFYSFFHFKKLGDFRGMAFILVVMAAGFHDHNLLNHKTFIGLLGLLGTLAYLENSKIPQRHPIKREMAW